MDFDEDQGDSPFQALINTLLDEKATDDNVANVAGALTSLAEDEKNIPEIRELGAIKALINRLRRHQNISVRRKVAAALTNMAVEHESAKEIIQEGAIDILIPLMEDDNPVVRAYAMGVLANLANEGQAKKILKQSNAIPLIARGLSDGNADIKTSCATMMGYLCLDSACATEFRDLEAFNPLAECLTHTDEEELLIKCAGALWNCGVSSENVPPIRESRAIPLLSDLISHHEDRMRSMKRSIAQEITANSVVALSMLSLDTDCVKMMKDSQAHLHTLNVIDIMGRNENEEGDNDLFEMSLKAAFGLLWNVTSNDKQCRKEIVDSHAVDAYCRILHGTDNEVVLEKLLGALFTLAMDSATCADICEHDAIIRVVPFLRYNSIAQKGQFKLQRNSIRTVYLVCRLDEKSRAVTRDCGALDPIIRLLSAPNEELQEFSSGAIEFCALDDDNCTEIRKLNGIPPLIKLMSSSYPRIEQHAVNALSNLARNRENLRLLREYGVIDPLIKRLKAMARPIDHLLDEEEVKEEPPAEPQDTKPQFINGFDADGYDAEGFDKYGFNRDDIDRTERMRNGRDQEGQDLDGFFRDGYTADGYDRKGRKRSDEKQQQPENGAEQQPNAEQSDDTKFQAGSWRDGQENTFTRWINHQLSKRGIKVNDIQKDLANGKVLNALLEELSGQHLPKINDNPKMKIQKIENINNSLKFMTEQLGCKLVNVSAEDIHDGNINIILGTIWTLILKYQINKQPVVADQTSKDTPTSKSTPQNANTSKIKQELLVWIKDRLRNFTKYCGEITNFTDCFSNGLALCCLVESFLPDSMKLDSLAADKQRDPECWIENNERAIYMAFKNLGIPNVVTGIDIALNTDELSIITYVSYFKEKATLAPSQQ